MNSRKPAGNISMLPSFMTLSQKLRLQLIDIEQDLRLSQHIPHFKKSVMRCTEILYDSEQLFSGESDTFVITKRIFACLSVAFAKIFQTVEKITAENNQLQAQKQKAGCPLVQDQQQYEAKGEKSRLGGASIGNFKRGLDPAMPQPVKQSNYSRLLRQHELSKPAEQEVEDTQLSLNLTPQEMEHFKTSESTISSKSFLNRIGAHLNSIRQKTDQRRQVSFQQHLKSILVQFQSCQKQTTAFINKQALDMPICTTASDIDLKAIVDETQQERSRWKSEAATKLAVLIDKSKASVVGVFSDMQKHIEKLESQAKAFDKPGERAQQIKPKTFMNREIQTLEAQTNHWLMQDYHNKTIHLDEQTKRVAQLEKLLYNSRYQLDDTKFESSRLKEYSTLYKQQVETLREKFGALQMQIILLTSQNREFKQQRQEASEANLDTVVDECAVDYSLEMKLAIKNAVEKVLRKMGLFNTEVDSAKPAEPSSISKRISRSSRMSIRSVDSHSLLRKSLLEDLAQVKKLHNSVVISVQEHLIALQQPAEESDIHVRSRAGSFKEVIDELDEEDEDLQVNNLNIQSKRVLRNQSQDIVASNNLPTFKNIKTQSQQSQGEQEKDTDQSKQFSIMEKYKKRTTQAAGNGKAREISPLQRASAKQSIFRPKSHESIRESVHSFKSIGSEREMVCSSIAVQAAPEIAEGQANTEVIQLCDQSVQTEEKMVSPQEFSDPQAVKNIDSMLVAERFTTQLRDEKQPRNSKQHRKTVGFRAQSPTDSHPMIMVERPRGSIVNLHERELIQNPSTNNSIQKRASTKGIDIKIKAAQLFTAPGDAQSHPDSIENSTTKEGIETGTRKSFGNDNKLRTRKLERKKNNLVQQGTGPRGTCAVSRRESIDRFEDTRGVRAQSNKTKDEIEEATERILEAGLLEHQPDQVRTELQLLIDCGTKPLTLPPHRLNKKTLTEMLQSVRRVHEQSCGSPLCKHLVRFIDKMKQLLQQSKASRKKPLGVKLHDIREIHTANQSNREVDNGWSRQRQLMLR